MKRPRSNRVAAARRSLSIIFACALLMPATLFSTQLPAAALTPPPLRLQQRTSPTRPRRAAPQRDGRTASSPAASSRTVRAQSSSPALSLTPAPTPSVSTGSSVTVTLTPLSSQGSVAATPTPVPTPAIPTQQPATPAQPTGEAVEDDEVVRVTSNLVVVPVSVTDAQGAPVQGLQVADFTLEEQGRRQEIAQIGDPEQVPLAIAILFDASSSVTHKGFYTFQQQSAVRFLKQVLKPADRAAVFVIGEKPRLEQGLASSEVATAKLLTIPAATVPTPTAFYDSVSAAAQYLASNTPGRHRRVIVVLSDGDDNFSDRVRNLTVAEARAQGRGESTPAAARALLQERHRRAVTEVQRDVERAEAVFYSINPGGPSVRLNAISTRAQEGMRRLAETTGGNSFVPDKLENLEAIFRQIASELRSQYLLQYYSNNEAPPGTYLGIKVRAPARTDLRVRARQGYYVPTPK